MMIGPWNKLVKMVQRVKLLLSGKIEPSWQQIEYFNPEWKQRIRIMSQYIAETDSVVDLGCGQKWLKEFLSPLNRYTGVDYRQRDGETIICDFNKYEYPNIPADVYFISGCLEYVDDYESLIENVANNCRRCIISYCGIEDFSDMRLRRQRAWVNDMSRQQLIDVFGRKGMDLVREDRTQTNNSIFVFGKKGCSSNG